MTDELTQPDLEIITDEESRYKTAHERVVVELKKSVVQLKHDQDLARDLTSQIVNTSRDEEKQALQSDEYVAHGLAKLRLHQSNALGELVDQPYFARVVYNENNKDTEFKLGLASFPELRIVDWRKSPISKLYYDYQEGDSYDDEIAGVERRGTVKLKRAYRGRTGELVNIDLKDISFVKSRGAWHKQRRGAREAFSMKDKERLRELINNPDTAKYQRAKEHGGYLGQVLSLLSPEQFAQISSATHTPVIIQGSAGTGKTTIALHRLAWLLFEGNSSAKAENTLVIVFNKSLAAYIKFVLPELGIKNVAIATFHEWATDISQTVLNKKPRDEIEAVAYLEEIIQSGGDYRSKKFPVSLDFLLVDEAQDFTVSEIKAALYALNDKNMLILAGDLGQKILENRDFGSWQELLLSVGLKGVDVLNLNIAYRSTYQIYELAEAVRNPQVHDEELFFTPKFGPEPTLTICASLTDAVLETKKWIEDVTLANRTTIAAVICKTLPEARSVYDALIKAGTHGIRYGDHDHFEFTPGITITDVRSVKGLEFESVLLFNPSAANYQDANINDRNNLYVAITRAEHRLDMICHEEASALIPDFIARNDLTTLRESDDEPLFSDTDQDLSQFEEEPEEGETPPKADPEPGEE